MSVLRLYRVQADCTWDDATMAAYYMAFDITGAIEYYKADLIAEDQGYEFDDWKFSAENVPSPRDRPGIVR